MGTRGACGDPMIIHGGAHPMYRCPDGIAFARKRIGEKLGELARTRRAEIEERQKGLGGTESRIAIAGLEALLVERERSGERQICPGRSCA